MEKTDWLPGDLKPVRPGIYERRLAHGPYARWNGRQWFRAHRTIAAAARETGRSGAQTQFAWRGLAADPSGAKA